ncbi:hypothetical protein [Hyphomicrobium sp. MC8b]|uniref:hypothetical protein n=1 Tax=Hyphomicrobium sp. MC8b TaxID=300273 RepID=UPI00391C2A3E
MSVGIYVVCENFFAHRDGQPFERHSAALAEGSPRETLRQMKREAGQHGVRLKFVTLKRGLDAVGAWAEAARTLVLVDAIGGDGKP